MNKVYSCAFLSALDKNTSWLLFHVHVLRSGDEISLSTHCTSYCFSSEDQMREENTSGRNRQGKRMSFCLLGDSCLISNRVLQELTWSSSSDVCPHSRLCRDKFESLLMTAEVRLSVPVCVCMSCSDCHN